VPFLTFRNDFKLLVGELIVVSISAYNAYGWGLYTQNTAGAVVKTEPQKPAIPI